MSSPKPCPACANPPKGYTLQHNHVRDFENEGLFTLEPKTQILLAAAKDVEKPEYRPGDSLAVRVNYCPWCGRKLPGPVYELKKAKETPWETEWETRTP